ncbi:holin [Klebsiella phage YMC16/01/N133_KPN_BP]|uniref:Holin n=1 Tax=Klebsiella phage YMC16/01/N133_KPN_BP TaxID=2026102 RepID=A0A248XD83_9CAUD|nr:holin [Klebsiella phage YMC16/01/N133_KPN_BP]ASW27655.1 hypothetical protein KPNN133_036 [Klebsiella phage YMC16/01/N133_KPN_BP]
MTDPVTTGTTLTAAAAGVGAIGWWAGLDPGTVVGAFTGAVFFVTYAKELTTRARFGYGFVSFVFGIVCAQWFAELLSWVVSAFVPGDHSKAPVPVGAVVAATLAIRILTAISTKEFSNAVISRLLSWLQAVVAKPKNGGSE